MLFRFVFDDGGDNLGEVTAAADSLGESSSILDAEFGEDTLEFLAALDVEAGPVVGGAVALTGVDHCVLDDTVEGGPLSLGFFGEVLAEEEGHGLEEVAADDGVVSGEGAVEDVAHAELLEGFDGLGHFGEHSEDSGDGSWEVHGLLVDGDLLEEGFLEEGVVSEEGRVEGAAEATFAFTEGHSLLPSSLNKRERKFRSHFFFFDFDKEHFFFFFFDMS